VASSEVPEVRTARLVLRGFREDDLPANHALFNDPEVIRYLPIRPPGLTWEEVEAGYGETEVLYALDQAHWGMGLATEAAGATLLFGFESAGLERIVAFAVPENRASTRVMEKVGMRPDGEADLFGLHLLRYAIRKAELL